MTMKYAYLAVFFLLAGADAAAARVYTVDKEQSRVAFSGVHAGNAFEGVFDTWTADIDFDPENLAGSSIRATFDTASARTGNKMYDGTLPQADWFDVKNHAQATFVSTSIRENADGGYIATGDLTIRGTTAAVDVPFTLSDLTQTPVKAEARVEIDRLAFGIGKKSDEKAEWVDRAISVSMTLSATPAP